MRVRVQIVFVIWSILALLFLFMAKPSPNKSWEFLAQAYLFAFGPPILLGFLCYRWYTTDKALHREMLSSAEVDENSHLVFLQERSGIAINPKKRTFTLMAKGVIKTYAFSQFRGYRTWFQPRQYGDEGDRNLSGLFIDVTDSQYPQWKIGMFLQATQSRWSQILDLEIINARDSDERA